MKNELTIFENEEFGKVRGIEIDGEPWLVGKDVAEILGYADLNKAIAMHVDEEDKLNDKTASSLGQRGGWFINESGVYSLIISSKLSSAKRFKHWVTSEVLPSIRKHGAYMSMETIEKTLTDPDFIIKLATALKEERIARQKAEKIIEEQKPLVDFAETVTNSTDCIDFQQFAKILADRNIKIGRNRLFDLFREKGILMESNVPYQRYIESGLFKVIETTYYQGDKVKITPKTLFTPKGQLYFANKIVDWVA